MPKTTKSGKVKQDELPSTLKRSDSKAQRTYAKAHASAAEQYGRPGTGEPGRLQRAQAHPREGR